MVIQTQTELVNTLSNSSISDILDVKSLCYFKRQLKKFMEEKPPGVVPFREITVGFLGLTSKVPEAREYSGKVPPLPPYTFPSGHCQKEDQCCFQQTFGLALCGHSCGLRSFCSQGNTAMWLVCWGPFGPFIDKKLPRCLCTWPSPGYSHNSTAAIGQPRRSLLLLTACIQ